MTLQKGIKLSISYEMSPSKVFTTILPAQSDLARKKNNAKNMASKPYCSLLRQC
jgi:hypothetical protein